MGSKYTPRCEGEDCCEVVPEGCLLYADTFTGSDTTNIPSSQEVTGDWSITDGALVSDGLEDVSLLLFDEEHFYQYDLEMYPYNFGLYINVTARGSAGDRFGVGFYHNATGWHSVGEVIIGSGDTGQMFIRIYQGDDLRWEWSMDFECGAENALDIPANTDLEVEFCMTCAYYGSTWYYPYTVVWNLRLTHGTTTHELMAFTKEQFYLVTTPEPSLSEFMARPQLRTYGSTNVEFNDFSMWSNWYDYLPPGVGSVDPEQVWPCDYCWTCQFPTFYKTLENTTTKTRGIEFVEESDWSLEPISPGSSLIEGYASTTPYSHVVSRYRGFNDNGVIAIGNPVHMDLAQGPGYTGHLNTGYGDPDVPMPRFTRRFLFSYVDPDNYWYLEFESVRELMAYAAPGDSGFCRAGLVYKITLARRFGGTDLAPEWQDDNFPMTRVWMSYYFWLRISGCQICLSMDYGEDPPTEEGAGWSLELTADANLNRTGRYGYGVGEYTDVSVFLPGNWPHYFEGPAGGVRCFCDIARPEKPCDCGDPAPIVENDCCPDVQVGDEYTVTFFNLGLAIDCAADDCYHLDGFQDQLNDLVGYPWNATVIQNDGSQIIIYGETDIANACVGRINGNECSGVYAFYVRISRSGEETCTFSCWLFMKESECDEIEHTHPECSLYFQDDAVTLETCSSNFFFWGYGSSGPEFCCIDGDVGPGSVSVQRVV